MNYLYNDIEEFNKPQINDLYKEIQNEIKDKVITKLLLTVQNQYKELMILKQENISLKSHLTYILKRILLNKNEYNNNNLYKNNIYDTPFKLNNSLFNINSRNKSNKRSFKHVKSVEDNRTKLDSLTSIKFINVNNDKVGILFSENVSSRLVSNRKNSYYNVGNRYLKCENSVIKSYKKKFMSTFKNEVLYFISEFRHKKLRVIKPFIVKMCYFLTRFMYKNKNIYVTYDKIFKGGDCGEYMFRYLNDNTKEKAYYIINKDTMTYKKLSRKYKKRLLIFGSLKCKLISLNAKYILSTDSEAASFCSFNKYMREFMKGYFNADVLHIQHGVTMQNMTHRQNRVFDNHKMYFVTSKYEKDNMLDPRYGYDKKDLIETGLARFDGLIDKSENIILITPTWRVDVASSTGVGKVRTYNEDFKHTKYFKIYNSLINDKKLIDIAKKNNYKIIFLIHPTLVSNISDYDKNDLVEIIPSNEIDYEDMLTKAKIMITDYSGVQYDFAYMHKPIVYYHNDDLPPSYDNGAMIYDKIGFGKALQKV